jgi:hypothetical protein
LKAHNDGVIVNTNTLSSNPGFVDVLDIAGFILHRYQLDQDRLNNPQFVEDTVFHEPVEHVVNFR